MATMTHTKKKIYPPIDGTPFFAYTLDWLEDWAPQQGLSQHTVISYRSSLKLLFEYITTLGHNVNDFYFRHVDRDFVRGWLQWLVDIRHNSNSTANTRLAALKAYIEFAVAEDPILVSVKYKIDTVHPLKVKQTVKQILNREQIQLLIDCIPDNPRSFRDRVMIMLMLETACRVSELLSLKVNSIHINTSDPYIKFDGKGKKQRVVMINQGMAQTLKDYFDIFHNNDYSPVTDLVFYTIHDGQATQMSSRTFQTLLSKYCKFAREKDLTFPERVHPHMLRRSRATLFYQENVPYELVSGILGHERLETTAIYATPSLEMIREAVGNGLVKQHDEPPRWKSLMHEVAQYLGPTNNTKRTN